jgi:hypothetical protein
MVFREEEPFSPFSCPFASIRSYYLPLFASIRGCFALESLSPFFVSIRVHSRLLSSLLCVHSRLPRTSQMFDQRYLLFVICHSFEP